MVKKYGNGEGMFRANAVYVSLEDYLALRDALREALNGWAPLTAILDAPQPARKRIAQLRTVFLDDK